MENEIKLFYDADRTKEASNIITFDPIDSGKETKKSLYIYNYVPFKVNIDISVEGIDVTIIKNIKEINPNEQKEIIISMKPKITSMKPIDVKLNIKLDYIIK